MTDEPCACRPGTTGQKRTLHGLGNCEFPAGTEVDVAAQESALMRSRAEGHNRKVRLNAFAAEAKRQRDERIAEYRELAIQDPGEAARRIDTLEGNLAVLREQVNGFQRQERRALEHAYRLRLLWEFASQYLDRNRQTLPKPQGDDEAKMLAESATVAGRGATSGWLDWL